jgi:hypothetical protein
LLTEIIYETLESVRWSRGELRWKIILLSFLYIYNTCALIFWLKIPLLFDLRSWKLKEYPLRNFITSTEILFVTHI